MNPHDTNIGLRLKQHAQTQPHAPAIHASEGTDEHGQRRYQIISFAGLDARSDRIASGLLNAGCTPGERTVVLVKPGIDLIAIMYGLFKAGLVPVLIDPGIGRQHLKACLAQVAPTAFIGIGLAHLARLMFGWGRSTVSKTVVVGRGSLLAERSLDDVIAGGTTNPTLPPIEPDDTAAILFTSGSTGPPKGVVYQYRQFAAQVDMLRELYRIEPGETNVATFAPFALFDAALGMTTVLPKMDFTQPAKADPAEVCACVQDFGASNLFGSPALLRTVGFALSGQTNVFPTLKRVLSAGAPVTIDVLNAWQPLLPPGTQVYTPYGATECLPVASIGSDALLGGLAAKAAEGAGICVGQPVSPNQVSIRAITDIAAEELPLVEPGSVGEMVVQGPSVTTAYCNRPKKTRAAKLEIDGELAHRMGDVGYIDDDGRIWYCGRLAHRVMLANQTLFTEQVEPVFNQHPDVRRTALVGIWEGETMTPVLVVETINRAQSLNAELIKQLKVLGQTTAQTAVIDRFIAHPSLPVDIRHNSKIRREDLRGYAAKVL